MSHFTLFRLPLILAAIFIFGCSQEHPVERADEIRPAYVAQVRQSDGASAEYVGEVRAVRRAELAFAVAGKVVSVAVEPGDHVSRDQVLARLDEQPLRAQLTVAGNDVLKAEAALREVRLRADRLHVAQQASAVSATELSGIEAELSAAESTLRSAHAQQDAAQWSLTNSVLRAPFAGVVAERIVEVGQAAAPGMPLLKIDGQGRELSVLLPGRIALTPGSAIQMKASGKPVAGRVLRVNGRLEAGGLRRAFFSVPDEVDVGATLAVAIPDAETATSVLLAPLRAVQASAVAGEGKVMRLTSGDRTEVVAVRLGAVQGDWVRIERGLDAQDRVVVAGAAGISPGTRVKPVFSPEFAGEGQ